MSKKGFTKPRRLAHRSGTPRFEDGRPRIPEDRPNRGNFRKNLEKQLERELQEEMRDWGLPFDGSSPEDMYYDEKGRGDPDYVDMYNPQTIQGKRL